MENKSEQPQPLPQPRKRRMSLFWAATLATAIPLALLITLAMLAGSAPLGWAAGGAAVAAFLIAIVLIIVGRREIASGILAGIGFGALALVATCFAAPFNR
jgi:hypothetical protein